MPILVIADVHANLPALEAVLADVGAVDGVVSLGDMVGYGPQPNEVVECLRGLGAQCVAGNHEWAALGRLDLVKFNPAAAAAAAWTARALSDDARAYLAGLPVRESVEGACAVHGSPRDPIWEYILSPAVARANFGHFAAHVGLFGHTHVPAVHAASGVPLGAGGIGYVEASTALALDTAERYLINPGSVGQPRDGDPRAAYLLWDPAAQWATWRRVAYDVERTQSLMQAARLPAVLWQRLSRGQ